MNHIKNLFVFLTLLRIKASTSLVPSALFKFSMSGHRLTKHVVSERGTSNLLECCLYCLRKPSVCKSINYEARQHEQNSKNCQLINATKSTCPQNIMPDANYDYYEMLEKSEYSKEKLDVSEIPAKSEKCSKIKTVGEPIVDRQSGLTQGTWMKDPLGSLSEEKNWYINGYKDNTVQEFENLALFKAGTVAKTYNLPYGFDGTGSVVYGRYLYYNRQQTGHIVQYDMVTETVIKEATIDENINPRQYLYEWGGYSGMDMSIDENGLWVLYGLPAYSGRLCATHLNHSTLTVVNTFCDISTEPMTRMGNAFVICGIVYSIDSYSDSQTTINHAYDTTTKTATSLAIPFLNKFGYNSMVTYNPREKVLYSWDYGRQITYPLEFED
ncbi:noelin-like [Dendronephthya gigantea]|uniref:noelin-like n=1 Tax=Dendronephthya gigantea TaxID=151771 RepID=UPI00106C21A5|nr:noelin-like [Dendronephthya gigantea]